MNQNPITNSILNMVLVLAESVISIVLRFDPNLRKAMYPLAKSNTTVCIRSYLPHTQVFATFSNRGVLLDTKLADDHQKADVVINAYSHQLINSLISNDPQQISKLTMRGATETVVQLRHFLVQLGIASLFQSLIRTFKGNSKSDKPKSTEENKPDYKARIQEQQEQLNVLSLRNRELEMTIKEVQSKQKVTLIALVVVSLVAIGAIIGWVM